jgi:hypothetical protein
VDHTNHCEQAAKDLRHADVGASLHVSQPTNQFKSRDEERRSPHLKFE